MNAFETICSVYTYPIMAFLAGLIIAMGLHLIARFLEDPSESLHDIRNAVDEEPESLPEPEDETSDL